MGVVVAICRLGWGMRWQRIRESFDWSAAARLVTGSPLMFESMHPGPPIHSGDMSIFYSDMLIVAHLHIVDIAPFYHFLKQRYLHHFF